MQITFDTNTWQRVVVPERFPNDPKQALLREIHQALVSGRIKGFICETVATLEAIPKGQRSSFLPHRAEPGMVQVTANRVVIDPETGRAKIQMTIRLGGDGSTHPGLKPILADRLNAAFDLGFRLLPVSRFGTVRPPEIDREELRIPLTQRQREDIFSHLERVAAISDAIEARGVGFSLLEAIAARIQQRLGIPSTPWYNGIDSPHDAAEDKEIDRAFAEWADGDTVAQHIGYDLDAICTGDQGKTAGRSIFDAGNRDWLRQTYQLRILDIEGLAAEIRAL